MTKLLEEAIEKVRELSAKDQDNVALALLTLTGEDTPLVPLDEDTLVAIREGTEQARRGEFVPEEDMATFFKRHGGARSNVRLRSQPGHRPSSLKVDSRTCRAPIMRDNVVDQRVQWRRPPSRTSAATRKSP